MTTISATLLSDPGCPWAYSAWPALHALAWRYGEQLDWRVVTIGLAEDGSRYVERGYSPALFAKTPLRFKRFGMPFSGQVRARVQGTGRACRAIVSVRLRQPELAGRAMRALALGWFTTDWMMDEDESIARALERVPGIDARAAVAAIDSDDVEQAYQQDRHEARSAAGSPAALQGKTAASDGPERYTAPTVVLARDAMTLIAGGHQPLAAYDVLIANLDPTLERRPAPEDPHELLERFPAGLTTREVSTILAADNDEPDDAAATVALLDLVDAGRATREPLGDDALWRAA